MYGTFSSNEELQREVRVNVQRAIASYLEALSSTTESVNSRESSEPAEHSGEVVTVVGVDQEPDDPADYGFLDHQERIEEAAHRTLQSIEATTTLLNEIDTETRRQAVQVEQMSAPGISASSKKETINEFANFLKFKAAALKTGAALARGNFSTLAEALIMGLAFQKSNSSGSDQYRDSRDQLLTAAEETLTLLAKNRMALETFKITVENVPRITIQFNQAKRQLIDALNQQLEFHEQAERDIFEITDRS